MLVKSKSGAKALSSPRVDTNSIFSSNSDITLDMVEWYYKNSDTITIDMVDLNDRESIVTVTERFGNKLCTKSFTIGLSTKRLIYNNYMFYHKSH